MEQIDKHLASSPKLLGNRAVKTNEKRLIDAGLMHYEASISGFTERYRRGETPHTIHVWWARRPHSAMRALTFASLCKGSDRSSFELMSRLGGSGIPLSEDLEESSKLLAKQYSGKPRVLDMFGGGGTIPFEAAALGAETYSIDSNQLAVFIQRSLLSDAVNVKEGLREKAEISGRRILENLRSKTGWLYPQRKERSTSPYGYFWSYDIDCEECGKIFSLLKRPWVSKKNGKNLAFVFAKNGKQDFKIEQVPDDYKLNGNWVGRNGKAECPHCGVVFEKLSIKNARDRLLAVCLPANPGKEFRISVDTDLPPFQAIIEVEKEVLEQLNAALPKSQLPIWSGIVNPALYGFETHADFLNPRQRLVLLYLIQELVSEFELLQKSGSTNEARAIVGILSSLIDQLIDWNCRLSMWISQNEQVGRAFCGPGIAMMWEYFELDPLANGPANLWSKLDRVLEGLEPIKLLKSPVVVQHAVAQKMPFADNLFDAIVTDPPYYDNIFYSVLADFFYAWKRILFSKVAPELFLSSSTDTHSELVASTFRSGNSKDAHLDYVRNLSFALNEAARTLKPDGVFSFVYSHSSLQGWLAVVQSFRNSSIKVSSVQPLSIERKARPRAVKSDAVNTCVTFVGRKGVKKPSKGTDILVSFKQIVDGDFVAGLKEAGWNDSDIGVAMFAQGVGLLSNISIISDDMTDEEVLEGIEMLIQGAMPTFRIQKRGSI